MTEKRRRTAAQRNADDALGIPAEDWIEQARADGYPWSEIAARFKAEAGFRVSVETLRQWALARAEQRRTGAA
jgi:hypothetical protein